MSKEIVKVPDLGGAADVDVIEISVAVGDIVTEEQSLIVVESDKASMDIPSPFAGTVVSIGVNEGDTVSEGSVILELEVASDVNSQDDAAPNNEPVPNNETAAASTAAAEQSVAESVAEAAPSEDQLKVAEAAAPVEAVSSTIAVPDLGGADKVDIIEVLVSVGDKIAEGDGIVVMESDKASMELPSPSAGVITAVHVSEGGSLSEGDAVIDLNVEAVVTSLAEPVTAAASVAPGVKAAGSSAKPKAVKPTATAVSEANSSVSADRRRKTDVYAGPAVRKLARELGVDLSRVTGNGPRGRVTKDDLYGFVKALANEPQAGGLGIPKVPEIDFSQFGEIDIQPMSKLHKLTAANMHRSWLNVPHVTQFDEADITELEIFRTQLKPEMERKGIKITPLPFLFKAAAAALRANPAFNASLSADGESIVYKGYVNIGMAVDTPAGLMVPVIRDVDKKGIWELSEEILAMATKAKERKLKPNEMQGGCFTISSLGGIGGTGFTPIVNTPEVGILGISKMAVKPCYIDGELLPRKMLPLSLSYDHRAVNGGDAGRFFTFLAQILSDTRRLVL